MRHLFLLALLRADIFEIEMILRSLASNQPYTLLYIPIVGCAALLPILMGGHFVIAETNFPVDYWFKGLYSNQLLLNSMVLALVLGGAVLANYVFNKHEFLNVPVYVPGFIYTLSSAGLALIQLSIPALVANIFILLALNRHLAVFRQQRVLAYYFESAFWYGIAAVLFPPYIVLIAGMLLAILMTRAFQWRELLLPLIAFSIPFLYWLTWLYINDSVHNVVLFNKVVSWNAVQYFSLLAWAQQAFILACGITLLAGLPRYLFLSGGETNKSKSVKTVFLTMGLTVLLSFGLGYLFVLKWILLTLVVPITFISGYWLSNYRYSFIAPFVFYSLIISLAILVAASCGVF